MGYLTDTPRKEKEEPHKEGYWDGDEFVAFGARNKEIRLMYELRDVCGLRKAEILDLQWTFMVADIIMEKTCSSVQARDALKRLGQEPTDSEWLRAINAVDPYARGVLDFQKFVRLAAHFHQAMLTEKELVDAFVIFDRDKSGSIDAIELQDVLNKLGFPVTALESFKMLAEADQGDD